MKDKEIFEQLNNLSKLKPDTAWKDFNRELLFTQISASSPEKSGANIFGVFFSAMTSLSQPVMVVFLLFGLIGAMGIGLGVGENAKPGDSLYIAKKISEKTRSTFTFDEKKKVQLGIEFAKKRVEEIERVKTDGSNNKEEVDQLVKDLEREIVVAKERIEKIYTPVKVDESPKNDEEEKIDNEKNDNNAVAIVDKNDNNDEQVDDANEIISNDTLVKEEESVVYSAGSEKEEKGITISERQDANVTQEEEQTEKANTGDMLVQLEELLKNDDFGSALVKLDEVSVSISEDNKDNSVEEEVETEESATSTEEVLESPSEPQAVKAEEASSSKESLE